MPSRESGLGSRLLLCDLEPLNLPLRISVSFPHFPGPEDEDEKTSSGCREDTGGVAFKVPETQSGLGEHQPWPCLASVGCLHPSPGTFSLCPMPVCVPSCQPWQASQACLLSSSSCAWWGKSWPPPVGLPWWALASSWMGLGERRYLHKRQPHSLRAQEFWRKGQSPPALISPAHFLSP